MSKLARLLESVKARFRKTTTVEERQGYIRSPENAPLGERRRRFVIRCPRGVRPVLTEEHGLPKMYEEWPAYSLSSDEHILVSVDIEPIYDYGTEAMVDVIYRWVPEWYARLGRAKRGVIKEQVRNA